MGHLFLIITICISVFMSEARACGGDDLSDSEIAELSYVLEAKEKMASVYSTPVVIESIIRSGNEILNLDKKSTVRAMCAANFINVYFTSEEPSELLCKVTFQIQGGQADFSGLINGLFCRENTNARGELIE